VNHVPEYHRLSPVGAACPNVQALTDKQTVSGIHKQNGFHPLIGLSLTSTTLNNQRPKVKHKRNADMYLQVNIL
jgi:hypothetical protein